MLEVSNHFESVHLEGIGGLKLTEPGFKFSIAHVSLSGANVVILELGSNDLLNTEALKVSSKILNIADKILKLTTVQFVIVCGVLPREHFFSSTPSSLQTNIREYNQYMKKCRLVNHRIYYHQHKGFYSTPIGKWSADGIHPNTEWGLTHYRKNIRDVLFKAAHLLSSA